MTSFSKFSKSELISVSFSNGIILLAKCVMVSGTRQLAPVSGARKWSVCHQLKTTQVCWNSVCLSGTAQWDKLKSS